MALSEKDKELILADYHTGKYSQRDLSKKHDVSLGTINKLTKDIEPKNEHLVNAQIAVLSAKSNLENEQMNAIMNTANDIVRHKGIVFGNAEKALAKLNKMIDEVDSPSDLHTLISANDKASITLGVNQRHANTIIANNNTQTNNKLEIKVTKIGD